MSKNAATLRTAEEPVETDVPRAGWLARLPRVAPGDAVMAALGILLAIVCALFPWYIFFNQEQFGIRALKFQGNQTREMPTRLSPQPSLIGAPISTGEIQRMEVDLISTATLPGPGAAREAPGLDEQPFPADLVEYRLVHVANGRAMIEDADGLFVVLPGSLLPDSSRVRSIEEREGRWVLVTTLDRVVELTP